MDLNLLVKGEIWMQDLLGEMPINNVLNWLLGYKPMEFYVKLLLTVCININKQNT